MAREKIDLSKFDSRWAGAYLMVNKLSYREVIEVTRKQSKLERDIKRNDRKLERLEKELKEGNDTDEIYEQIEKIEDQKQKLEMQNMEVLLELIKSHILEGKVYDEEKKALVNYDPKQIEDFDIGTITEISQVVSGSTGKNV